MSKDNKYWIPVLSWNLLESMTTESISPFGFYLSRHFGNDVRRFVDTKNEAVQYLLVYKTQPDCDYAIQIDKSSIEDQELIIRKEYVLCPKTVYFRHGKVKFFFRSQELLDKFIADASILLEVKGIEQYKDDFVVGTGKKGGLTYKIKDELSFTEYENLEKDDSINACRGALTGYVRGETITADPRQQELLLRMINFNNDMAGLNTDIMVNDSFIPDGEEYAKELHECEQEYKDMGMKDTFSFSIIGDMLKEIVKLCQQKSEELKSLQFNCSSEEQKELGKLQIQKETINSSLKQYKEQKKELKKQLDRIKALEVENGKAQGKQRKLFSKGTEEYSDKQRIKSALEKIKSDETPYIAKLHALNSSINDIMARINSSNPYLKYNSAIESTFSSMSDTLDNLITTIRTHAIETGVDMSELEINNGKILLKGPAQEADIYCFNQLLSFLLEDRENKKRIVPENFIISLIVRLGKNLAGKQGLNGAGDILTDMRSLWLYKSHKSATFNLTTGSEIMRSVYSFLLKYQGFEQIDRFMMNRHYTRKSLAFMLWGACIGYAAIPKTFTDDLPIGAEDVILNSLEHSDTI